MCLGYLVVFLLGFYGVVADPNVTATFIESRLVPDVVSKPPPNLLEVKYSMNVSVCLGNNLNVTQVALQPTIVCWPADPNKLYTLLMVDPDAPSPSLPLFRQVKHWLIENIPGSSFRQGNTQATYLSPTPTPGTGPHRYTILVYEQQKISATGPLSTITLSLGRLNFNLNYFVTSNNLTLHAGNFYRTRLL